MLYTQDGIPWNIEGKTKIIKNFVPVAKPEFKNEDAIGYIIWNLYNRVSNGMKSFATLIDNKCYYDAFIIAGHMLETCAILSYIKDNDTEEEQKENYNKYLARSAVGRMIANLEMATNLHRDLDWIVFETILKILYPIGSSIIKDQKNPKEKHEEVTQKINYRLGTNEEKIKLLKKHYEPPHIEEYIKAFSDNRGNTDDGQFARWYTKYCNYKHSNMLAPGALAGDINDDEVNYFLDLVLIILVYLDKNGLKPTIYSSAESKDL